MTRRRILAPLAVAGGAAALWWLVGFLPWLAHGLHHPGLTGGPFAPDQGVGGVRTAVPLLAEDLLALVSMAVLGGAVAGLLTRVGPRLGVPRAVTVGAVVAGVTVACGIALAQSRRALADGGTGQFATDDRVLGALQLVAAASTALGVLAGALAALGPVVVRATALAVPVALLPTWLQQLVVTPEPALWTWGWALAMGLALGVSVAGVAWRFLGWIPAAALAWTAQAAVPAILVAGTRIRPGSGLAHDVWAPVEVGMEVLRAALTTVEAHRPGGWLAALLLGAVVAGALGWRERTGHDKTPARAGSDGGLDAR